MWTNRRNAATECQPSTQTHPNRGSLDVERSAKPQRPDNDMITQMTNQIYNWLKTKLRAGRCWLRRFVTPPELAKPLRPIVEKYFEEHPDAKDGVMKAWYAYHAPHFRVKMELPLHNFTNSQRESKCVWCGRSREMVRHDELDARCQNRPKEIKSIQEVLRDEGEHALALA